MVVMWRAWRWLYDFFNYRTELPGTILVLIQPLTSFLHSNKLCVSELTLGLHLTKPFVLPCACRVYTILPLGETTWPLRRASFLLRHREPGLGSTTSN